MKKARHIGQKIALATAVFCALMMLPALLAFAWVWHAYGLGNSWTPSLLATVGFFGCCAAVLYSMSRAQPDLPPEAEEAAPEP